jgi:hypothetical protein
MYEGQSTHLTENATCVLCRETNCENHMARVYACTRCVIRIQSYNIQHIRTVVTVAGLFP